MMKDGILIAIRIILALVCQHYTLGFVRLSAFYTSYKLDIKKWQARSSKEKASVKQRSYEIKQRFKHEMGLIVDKPKPGFGSRNDGNTARRFFGNPELSAQITGLDVTIIKHFDVLLRTLSSFFEINLVEFEKFCLWYYMPATVHKLLIHSTEVIKTAIVPIGQLSEEAQETRKKDVGGLESTTPESALVLPRIETCSIC